MYRGTDSEYYYTGCEGLGKAIEIGTDSVYYFVFCDVLGREI